MLDRINEIILEQDGKEVSLNSKLIDSEMDSFSYAFFWAYVQDEYPEFTDEYVNVIDYTTFTIKEMVDKHENS
jgi:hypothetical protein